ncbi:unnamed protein product [Clonostachys solani]|uniref:Uncharacterized protein n=1 Tax=Clonostachys solani TaxID=160281 RepID=A0A9N9ZFV9_9HYPO|nr:unnamed protein product [Clonostachys solani]
MPWNLEKPSQHLAPKFLPPPFLAARPEALVPRALSKKNRKTSREVMFDLFPLCVEITSELKSRVPDTRTATTEPHVSQDR